MSTSTQAEPVRIQNAADLFKVLTTGAIMQQYAVLQSIASDPQKPLALGPHEGEDFVDLLIRLIPQHSDAMKQLQILCLMSYQDERTTKFMVEEFSRSRDSATVLRLAGRIELEGDIEFFRPFLWSDKSAQALAAARLCSRLPNLEPAEILRVAILTGSLLEPPSLSERALDTWMTELKGRHRVKAQKLASANPHEALILWQRWSDLTPESQEWLQALTSKVDSGLLKEKLPRLLRDPQVSTFTVTLGLQLGVALPSSLLDHTEPVVRAAAISGGLAEEQLDSYLAPGVSTPEALAATGRCAPERLVNLLGDKRWQVRAAAVNRICALEEPPLEALRLRTNSDFLGARVAAVKALEHFDDGDWLGEHFSDEVKQLKEEALSEA